MSVHILNAAFAALAVLALQRNPAPMIYITDCLQGLGWIATLT